MSYDNSYRGLAGWVKAYIPRFRKGLLARKPLLFLNLAKAIVSRRLFNDKKVLSLDYGFSAACNLKCRHCFSTSFGTQSTTSEKPPLTTDQMKTVLKKCVEAGIITFNFQGGEPLMDVDLLAELINTCSPWNKYIQITTNGTLATEENLQFLKESGLDGVSISIDSFSPETHDEFRGVKGTFEKAMHCLEIAGKLGLTRTICPVVSKNNARDPDLVKLFNYATERNIGVQPTIAMMVGNWRGKWEIMLGQDEINWLHQLYQKNRLIRRDMYNNFTFPGCPAFKTLIYLTPKGEVTPCPFIHISFGNLLELSLEEIVARARKLEFFRDSKASPVCLAGEDRMFIEKYLVKTFGEDKVLPISCKEAFPEIY